MILLFNVKITDVRFLDYRRSSHFPKNNRMDVFKYCLASCEPLLPLVSKCFLYLEVAPEFLDRKQELEDYIRSIFPEEKIVLHWYRNNFTRDWRLVCDEIDTIAPEDDMIWMACNDDHIFLDNNIDVIKNGLELLEKDPDPMAMLYYSHWPEQMRMSNHHGGQLVEGGNYVKYTWANCDAIQIIKRARFKKYWFDKDYGDEWLFKTDQLIVIAPPIHAPAYIPTKEIVRHYDGYGHIGNVNNQVCPLFIPPGFFENGIKIRYGYDERDGAFTNLNPSHPFLYAFNPLGTDYRWALEDIPEFWKSRIKEITVNPSADIRKIKKDRNQNIVNCGTMNMSCFNLKFDHTNTPPEDWFKEHFI
jgi:hypothetical protein